MTDVFDARFARNPWPTLERLRTTGDGIHRVRTPDGPPAWLVTRYHDVRAGLLDRRLSTQARYAKGDDYRGFAVPPPLDAMLAAAPADHARLRGMVTAELSPRRLDGTRSRTGRFTSARACRPRPTTIPKSSISRANRTSGATPAQLALGHGTHACLGNALVRTVTAAAIDHVLARWPDSALAVDEREIVWRSGFRHRGPLTLPVELR